jgi:hypothetical protein
MHAIFHTARKATSTAHNEHEIFNAKYSQQDWVAIIISHPILNLDLFTSICKRGKTAEHSSCVVRYSS